MHASFDQRIFHRECRSLADTGLMTHLLVQLPEHYTLAENVHVHSVGKPAKDGGFQIARRLRRLRMAALRAQALDADIYHLHDPELIPLGLWLKATTSGKVVFDCHENNTAYIRQKHYVHPGLRNVLATTMGLNERFAARFFDAIITADQGVADLYTHRYGARRTVTLYNFPRLDLFPSPPPAAAEPTFDLVYHGTLPRYHLEISFAVAEELRSRGEYVRWLFFGKCPQADWAHAEAKRRGLAEVMVIDPQLIPHDQVATRVRTARIGFIPLPDLPKFQHNIPTKLFEYMALEMPVVLSDLPPSRPFVGDGKCAIMVKADDPRAYAEAISTLIHDPERCRTMGAEGRRRVEQEYNWEHEALKLLQLYEELLPG